MRTRRRLAAVLMVAALALAGCAGLPTTGAVNPGLTADEIADAPDLEYYPKGPAPQATPTQIVSGFVDAATSPVDNWEVAREFLTEDFASVWNPQASVTIDVPSDRVSTASENGTGVSLQITPTATLDDTGAYNSSTTGEATMSFTLEQREDGEWRIAKAPDGILLDEDNFPQVYDDHVLYFFDPSWTYLVPDVRWFPSSSNTATRIAQAVIDGGPSQWLAGSVVTAFPVDVTLDRNAVPVDEDRRAEVALSSPALSLDATTVGRMAAQMEASLESTDAQSVEFTVADEALSATTVSVRSTAPDPRAMVLSSERFGYLSGDEVTPIGELSSVIESIPERIRSIVVSADRRTAAARIEDGPVYRVRAGGEVDEVDGKRDGLIDPALDPQGYLWTVPEDDPTAIRAWDEDVVAHEVTGAWPEASRIAALSVSRDGTRVAALVTAGTQHWLQVAGIIRDADGVPVSLGESNRLAELPAEGTALGWLSDDTLGVAAGTGDEAVIIDQPIGGIATVSDSPAAIATIAAGSQETQVRLLSGDGTLYVRRGAAWPQVSSDILVLATQLGVPADTVTPSP